MFVWTHRMFWSIVTRENPPSFVYLQSMLLVKQNHVITKNMMIKHSTHIQMVVDELGMEAKGNPCIGKAKVLIQKKKLIFDLRVEEIGRTFENWVASMVD